MQKFLGWLAVAAVAVATGCGSSSESPPVTTTYTVGGTVTGLTGTGLVLRNNGGNDLAVSANGAFAFSTALTSGSAYAVTVAAQPTGQTCVVSNGTGTVASANVTNVAVACVSGSYTVGGTVSGLAGSGLVLRNNGGDDLAVSANGTFTFATPVAAGTAYAVTVATQPASPTQSCVVTNGAGNGTAGNVTNVQVTCATSSFTIGGTVSGLTGTGLTLLNKGGDALTVSGNGAFTFHTAIASGDTYDVTVGTAPTSPVQTCTVSGGSGTVGGAAVTNVLVTCSTNTYVVGGTVAGLAAAGLQLSLNGGTPISVNNGPFSFSTRVADGSPYAVTVAQQPTNPAQTCSVTNGSGTISGANVTDVAVACTAPTFTIGGTVTGLTGTGLVLLNNGGNALSVTQGGAFTFTTALTTGTAYAVTVQTQPSTPTQECVVTNASGTVALANVTNVTVTCTTSSFTVGGTVSGLSGTGLVLRNNGGDDLTRNATGAFTFTTPVASGATYAVTVATQPTNPYQVCTVTNGSGTVGAANVTNVSVGCVTPPQVVQSWTAPAAWGGTAAGFWANGETGMVQHLTFSAGGTHEQEWSSIQWGAPNGPPPISTIAGVGSLGASRTAAGPFDDAGQPYVATANDSTLDITGDMLVCAVVKPTWNLPFTGTYGDNDQIIFAKGVRGQSGWALLQALDVFSFRYETTSGNFAAYTGTDLVPMDGSYHGPINPTYVVICAGRDVAGGVIRIVANGWNSSYETAVAATDPMVVSPEHASVGGYASAAYAHDYGGRIYETAVWAIPATRANIDAKMAPVMGLSMPSGTTPVQYTRDREAYYPGAVVTPAPYHTGWKHEPRFDATRGILFGLQATNRVQWPEALQNWTRVGGATVTANNDYPPGDAGVLNAALVNLPTLSSISVPVTTFGNPGAVHGQIWLKSISNPTRGDLTISMVSAAGTTLSSQVIALPTVASDWNYFQLTDLTTDGNAGTLVLRNATGSAIAFEAWGVVATQLGRDVAGVTSDVSPLGFDPGPTIYNTLANAALRNPREVLALPTVADSTAGTGFCIGAQGQPATGMTWQGPFLDRRTMAQWYASDTAHAKIMVMGQASNHTFRFWVVNGAASQTIDVDVPAGLTAGTVAWVKGCVAADGTMRLYAADTEIGSASLGAAAPDLLGGTLYVGSDHTGTEPWHGYIQAAATCRNTGAIANCH